MGKKTQRWRVLCFSGLTVGGELLWVWGWVWSVRHGFQPPPFAMVTGMMWMPGMASLVCRMAFAEGFGDVGWRLGQVRYWAWAYLLPMAVAALAYFTALILGKVAPAPVEVLRTPVDALLFSIPLPFPDAGVAGMVLQRWVLVALPSGMIIGFFLAFGEELGWRGYLLTRILRTGWPFPLLLSGLIWGLFHFPFILLTNYGYHGPPTLVGYTTLTVLFGIFVSWLRLRSGSVWVAAMAHASFNAFIQMVGMMCFIGEDSWLWVGDYGILVLVPYGVLVVGLYGSGHVCAAVRPCVEIVPKPANQVLQQAGPA
jgi:membrane protease YdiL (CAAX protease family)